MVYSMLKNYSPTILLLYTFKLAQQYFRKQIGSKLTQLLLPHVGCLPYTILPNVRNPFNEKRVRV